LISLNDLKQLFLFLETSPWSASHMFPVGTKLFQNSQNLCQSFRTCCFVTEKNCSALVTCAMPLFNGADTYHRVSDWFVSETSF